jgi:hypothetical protein
MDQFLFPMYQVMQAVTEAVGVGMVLLAALPTIFILGCVAVAAAREPRAYLQRGPEPRELDAANRELALAPDPLAEKFKALEASMQEGER